MVVKIKTARLLWVNYDKLDDQNFIDKCENLYKDAPLGKDKPFVLRFPLLIFHRLCFIALACGLHMYIGLGLPLLLIGNLLFTMFWLNYRPCASRLSIRLEIFTVSGLHMSLILMVTQTPSNISSTAKKIFSFFHLGSFSAVVVINLLAMAWQSFLRAVRRIAAVSRHTKCCKWIKQVRKSDIEFCDVTHRDILQKEEISNDSGI